MARVKVRVDPDQKGIRRLGGQEFLRGPLEQVAQQIVDQAITYSPDAPPHGVGYVAAFGVSSDVEGGQVIAVAFNTDFKAHWIEYGTAPHRVAAGAGEASRGAAHPGTPAFRPLGRAVDGLT